MGPQYDRRDEKLFDELEGLQQLFSDSSLFGSSEEERNMESNKVMADYSKKSNDGFESAIMDLEENKLPSVSKESLINNLRNLRENGISKILKFSNERSYLHVMNEKDYQDVLKTFDSADQIKELLDKYNEETKYAFVNHPAMQLISAYVGAAQSAKLKLESYAVTQEYDRRMNSMKSMNNEIKNFSNEVGDYYKKITTEDNEQDIDFLNIDNDIDTFNNEKKEYQDRFDIYKICFDTANKDYEMKFPYWKSEHENNDIEKVKIANTEREIQNTELENLELKKAADLAIIERDNVQNEINQLEQRVQQEQDQMKNELAENDREITANSDFMTQGDIDLQTLFLKTDLQDSPDIQHINFSVGIPENAQKTINSAYADWHNRTMMLEGILSVSKVQETLTTDFAMDVNNNALYSMATLDQLSQDQAHTFAKLRDGMIQYEKMVNPSVQDDVFLGKVTDIVDKRIENMTKSTHLPVLQAMSDYLNNRLEYSKNELTHVADKYIEKTSYESLSTTDQKLSDIATVLDLDKNGYSSRNFNLKDIKENNEYGEHYSFTLKNEMLLALTVGHMLNNGYSIDEVFNPNNAADRLDASSEVLRNFQHLKERGETEGTPELESYVARNLYRAFNESMKYINDKCSNLTAFTLNELSKPENRNLFNAAELLKNSRESLEFNGSLVSVLKEDTTIKFNEKVFNKNMGESIAMVWAFSDLRSAGNNLLPFSTSVMVTTQHNTEVGDDNKYNFKEGFLALKGLEQHYTKNYIGKGILGRNFQYYANTNSNYKMRYDLANNYSNDGRGYFKDTFDKLEQMSDSNGDLSAYNLLATDALTTDKFNGIDIMKNPNDVFSAKNTSKFAMAIKQYKLKNEGASNMTIAEKALNAQEHKEKMKTVSDTYKKGLQARENFLSEKKVRQSIEFKDDQSIKQPHEEQIKKLQEQIQNKKKQLIEINKPFHQSRVDIDDTIEGYKKALDIGLEWDKENLAARKKQYEENKAMLEKIEKNIQADENVMDFYNKKMEATQTNIKLCSDYVDKLSKTKIQRNIFASNEMKLENQTKILTESLKKKPSDNREQIIRDRVDGFLNKFMKGAQKEEKKNSPEYQAIKNALLEAKNAKSLDDLKSGLSNACKNAQDYIKAKNNQWFHFKTFASTMRYTRLEYAKNISQFMTEAMNTVDKIQDTMTKDAKLTDFVNANKEQPLLLSEELSEINKNLNPTDEKFIENQQKIKECREKTHLVQSMKKYITKDYQDKARAKIDDTFKKGWNDYYNDQIENIDQDAKTSGLSVKINNRLLELDPNIVDNVKKIRADQMNRSSVNKGQNEVKSDNIKAKKTNDKKIESLVRSSF